MKVEKINGKYYQEIDAINIQKELEQKKQSLASINFDSLKEEYDNNVKYLKEYQTKLEKDIKELEKMLK